MEISKPKAAKITITEEIQLQWTNGKATQNSRCLVAFDGDVKVAELRYSKSEDRVKILDLTCFDKERASHLSWSLLSALGFNLSLMVIEPSAQVEKSGDFLDMVGDRIDNPAFASAMTELEAHLALCEEADAAISEVQQRGGVLEARIEVYLRYPNYLSREEETEKLSRRVAETSRYLYCVKRFGAALTA